MKATAFRLIVLVFVAGSLGASSAKAAFVVLTGTVKNSSGVGVAGVQINFVDACTAVLAGSTGNVTSATGTFSATVNAGNYDLEMHPPVGSLYAAPRILGYDLTTSKSLGVVTLQNGVTVAGHISDATGAPVSFAYLHFFAPNGGGRVYTIRDKTDTLGNYSVVIPPGTYDLRYGPHSGDAYLALMVPSVTISGPVTRPTVTLQDGLTVSGTVLDSVGAGNPIINVNVNAFDVDTGASMVLSHDRSDVTGSYAVVVPPGRYVFELAPEKCTHLGGVQSAATTVSADTSMPTVHLPAAVQVKGLVTDTNGVPVFDVNTIYSTAAGADVVTTDDHSDATGAFNTYLAPGTYAIAYSPPSSLRLAGVKTAPLSMFADPTSVPTVALPNGYFVSGRAVTFDGAVVPYVQVTFFTAGTGAPVYVAHNATDTAGNFSTVSVPGTYDVVFTPPAGTALVTVTRAGLVVGSDTVLTDTVLPYPAPALVSISSVSGSATGGQSVTVNGTGFRAGAGLAFGGVSASVISASSTTFTATTPAHPAGIVNVIVTNLDGQSGTLAGTYAYLEPAVPIALTAARSGADLVLTWTSTGQASYTVFRSATKNSWTDGSVLTHTSATSYTVVGGALAAGPAYFNVE